MLIAVIGGTGRTGALFVEAAVAGGHHVRLLARRPEEARAQVARLPTGTAGTVEVHPGDLRDPASLAPLVAGADAVVSLAGPVRGGGPHDLRDGARHVVAAMRTAGVDRLLWMTGAGVRRAEDTPGAADRAIVAVMGLVARRTLADSRDAVAEVTGSDLAWTVVRAPRLTDGPAVAEPRVRAGVGQGTRTQASRATVARALLGMLGSGSWVHGSPVVSD